MPEGEYLHWDDLRFRAPDGLKPKDFWFGVKLSRKAACRKTIFLDKGGTPFTYTMVPEIERLLHEIDSAAKGTLTSRGNSLEAVDGTGYLVKSLLEEPLHSSLLEGAATTRDMAKQLIDENRAPASEDEHMVLNNYRAMEFIKSIIDEQLTVEKINEIQNIVTLNTLENSDKAGIFRSPEDRITVSNDITGEIYHDPPAAEFLPERIHRICEFANGRSSETIFMHPVIRAVILHFMLAYEHPYVDGNGRTARALFYWSVLRDRYWLLEYASISSVIYKAPTAYGRAFLLTETDEGDLTYFIIHQLNVIRKAIDQLQSYLTMKEKEIEALKQSLARVRKSKSLSHRQYALLNDAARHPERSFTIPAHMKAFNVTNVTARKDFLELVKLGLLRKDEASKPHKYRAAPAMAKKLALIDLAIS